MKKKMTVTTIPMYPEYGDTATGEAEDQEASDEPADDLGR